MSADRPDRRRLGALIGLLEARGLWRGLVPGGGAAPAAVEIRAIAYDSRRVRPGDLFVALPGTAAEGHPFVDGHDFLADAIARGAVALVVERPEPGLHVPQVIVSAGRPALAVAAAWHAGFPSQRLGIVGVTGTDGKTTTCHLVRAILEASDRPTGLLGTVDVVVGGRARGNPERTTTPEAPELQGLLAEMEAAGDRWAVVESSSHGLALDRVADVAYDVAVVTNVTLDHLELHRTLAAYRAAKLSLFARLALGPSNPDKGFGKHGVVNLDDPLAAAFDEAARTAGAEVVTYGAAAEADVRLVRLEEDVRRLRLRVRMPGWNGSIGLPMAGRFNAHNALAALAVGQALGLDGEASAAALEAATPVAGRMERIDAGQPFGAIVDYAHTPDALAKVLDELAPLAGAAGGGLVAVFGSAGERDRVKRPLLGRAAQERCRLVVLTDEDPRGEDREAILEAIAEGATAVGGRRGQDVLVVPDRRSAIRAAIEAARPGDVVLFAGKGHEKTIETATGAVPWDEAAEVRAALAAEGWTG